MTFSTKTSSRTISRKSRRIQSNILNMAKQRRLLVFMRVFFAVLLMVLIAVITNAHPNHTVPSVPGPISGQINVCGYVGTSQEISYSIEPVAGATLYLWSVPPMVTVISGQGTTNIMVTFAAGFSANANKQIRVRAISDEGNSADRTLNLLSQLPSTPGVISGPSNGCIFIGTSSQATYSISRNPAASGYIWGTQAGTTTVTHPNGPGMNDTIIKVTFKQGFTNSPITVQAFNSCGFSGSRNMAVGANIPGTPGLMSGPTNVCPHILPSGTPATYSISPMPGVVAYTWIVPDDAVVTHPNGSGANDYTITVQFPVGFINGTISVSASNWCDDGPPRTKSVSRLLPGTPGVISGVQTIVCPNREYVYSLPTMPTNTTSILWTLPDTTLTFQGQGGSSIRVFYPDSFYITGTIRAQSINNCATGSTRQAPVQIGRCQAERPGSQNSITSKVIRQTATVLPGVQAIILSKKAESTTGEMEVKVFPNPSSGDFKIQVMTGSKEVINARILDLRGRELKRLVVKPFEIKTLESNLKAGAYLIEIKQGNQVKTTRVTKL